MSNIKYQVFISSTYRDLAEERRGVLDTLLKADCIPAGMEMFIATDEEQFEVIKRVIDLCDYYILILGRCYGSVNDKTGLSYTEMEYDYAVANNIPVLVFAMDESIELDDCKIESDPVKKQKLDAFRKKATNNRLGSVWKNKADLNVKVAIAIVKAKEEMKRPGWRRGDDESFNRLTEEIEIANKKEKIGTTTSAVDIEAQKKKLEGSFYGKRIELHFTEELLVFTSNTIIGKKNRTVTLDELFKFVSLRITGVKTADNFINAVSAYESGYYVDTQDGLILKNKYEQLGLIETFLDEKNNEMMRLTELGKTIMNELNA